MSGTKASRKTDATVARLLEQCEHAEGFRFEVKGAPSITIHVEPDGMGRWAVSRFGWQEPKTWDGDKGWLRAADVPVEEQFRWPVADALAAVPGLLKAEAEAHARWERERQQQLLQKAQAERAGQLAEVVEEYLGQVRDAVAEATADITPDVVEARLAEVKAGVRSGAGAL
jgi:hypothetical protein